LDLSRFEENLREEWERFPPPELIDPDVATERLAYSDHFHKVRHRDGEDRRGGVSIEDVTVPSLIDDHRITVRLYRPLKPESGRGLVYFHGGAFVMGDLDFEEEKCIELARGAGCLVVSVDYRLAPEYPYPTPLEDCYSALVWVADHAVQLSIDPYRLGIGGCSAGGALAASIAQLCRDRGGPALALQMLLYPVLDASLSEESVRTLQSEEEIRESECMWENYLGRSQAEPPGCASPAARRDLSGLAPTCIVAGELDFLRDEAITYAQRLLSAGVSVELQVWSRTPHAVDLFAPDATVSRQSVRHQIDSLARFLG
jgi:acetyl esterase